MGRIGFGIADFAPKSGSFTAVLGVRAPPRTCPSGFGGRPPPPPRVTSPPRKLRYRAPKTEVSRKQRVAYAGRWEAPFLHAPPYPPRYGWLVCWVVAGDDGLSAGRVMERKQVPGRLVDHAVTGLVVVDEWAVHGDVARGRATVDLRLDADRQVATDRVGAVLQSGGRDCERSGSLCVGRLSRWTYRDG